MPEFKFKNHLVEIDIENKKYTLNCNSDTGDLIKEHSAEFFKLSKDIEAGKRSKNEAIEASLRFIDMLLGDGSSKEIFTDRKVNMTDITDLIVFLIDEVKKFSSK